MTANSGSGSAALKGELNKLLLKAQKIKTKIKTEETSLFGIKNPPDGNIPPPRGCGIQNLQQIDRDYLPLLLLPLLPLNSFVFCPMPANHLHIFVCRLLGDIRQGFVVIYSQFGVNRSLGRHG